MAFSSLVRSAINRVTDVVQKCTRLFSGNTIQRTQEFEFSQTSVKAYALFVRPALIKKSNFNVHAFTVHSLRPFPKLSSAAFTLKPKDISEKDLKIVRGVWTALNSNQSQTFVRYQICKQALFQNVFANHRLYLHAVAQLYRKYNMRKILNAVAALELKRSNGVIHQDKIGGLFTPIREIFSESAHLLCTWHINRDVEGWVRKKTRQAGVATTFQRGSWSTLLRSATEEEYESNKASLLKKWYWVGYTEAETIVALSAFHEGTTKIGEYLDRTWILHKEKFVEAWTNRVRHFGNTTNCRTESQHSYIKNWIQSSTSAADTLFEEMHAGIETQIIQIKDSLESCRRKHDTEFDGFLSFVHLQGKVSTYCMTLMAQEIVKLKGWDYDVDKCDCVVMETHGIPCACSISMSTDEDRGVYLDEVDSFWTTLVIGDGVDVPTFAEEAEQDAQSLVELVDEVRASDPAVRRLVARLIHGRLHPHLDPLHPISEHVMNVNTRGAPRKSRSTQRVPSTWECRGRRSNRSRGRSSSRDASQCLDSGV